MSRDDRARDDRDSVRSVIEDLGLHGALQYARLRLPVEPSPEIRRIMTLIIKDTSERLLLDIRIARRLAACHRAGLRTLAAAQAATKPEPKKWKERYSKAEVTGLKEGH